MTVFQHVYVAFQQLNFLKHFLGGGFIKHMQENEFLHDVFSFTPKKIGGHSTMTNEEKVCFVTLHIPLCSFDY